MNLSILRPFFLFLTIALMLGDSMANGDDKPNTTAGWPWKINVKVSLVVHSAENVTADAVCGYLAAQFGKLDDVVVTDERPDYVVDVCVMPIKMKGDALIGYVLSFAIASNLGPVNAKSQIAVLRGDGKITNAEELKFDSYLKDAALQHHFILTSDTSSVEPFCAQATDIINKQDFRPFREFMHFKVIP